MLLILTTTNITSLFLISLLV